MKKKIALMALVVAMMFGVAGCGDELIELTQEEREQIVQFSAHIIGEFNKNQTEGYTALNKKQLDKIKHPEKYENKKPDVSPPEVSDQDTDNQGDETKEGTVIALSDVVGISGVEVSYQGFDVCKDYMESDVFSMSAKQGNKYVVVSVALKNTRSKDVSVDLLSKNLSLFLNVGDERIKASTTLLSNDFTTYEGKVKSGKKIKLVIVFEVSKKVADKLQKIELQVENNNSISTILIN